MTTDIEATARDIHDVLRALPESSPRHRALHARGVVATGRFTPTGQLAERTTAGHLVAKDSPATIRFSHTSGNPDVPDAIPSGRGVALKLATPAGHHDLVGVTSPAFLVRDGASFLELLAARAPDPSTGLPDPDRMLAFVAAHPESVPAITAAMNAKVPESYATLTYNGLHTFFLVDAAHGRHPFRWSLVPSAGDAFRDGSVDPALDLAAELADRLVSGPVTFDLVVHLGTADDPTGDPTAVWPERPTRVAGHLVVESLLADAEPIIFDPTNVTDGVALPDDDEILRLRSAAYGLSYATRTGT